MSRRGRHGHHPHSHTAVRPARTAGPVPGRSSAPDTDVNLPARPEASSEAPARAVMVPPPVMAPPTMPPAMAAPPEATAMMGAPVAAFDASRRPPAPPPIRRTAIAAPVSPADGAAEPVDGRGPAPEADRPPEDLRPTCTAAQLRRFIKSRPWVPMHELRRRFGINGSEDDVTPIRVGDARLYIGMPPTEGHLMAELLGSGDVGYELSFDPGAPIVVGVYPMRPVPRS